MSFSAVGSKISPTVTSKTFTLVPNTVGDFILLSVISTTVADWATALSSAGGNVTWTVLSGHNAFATNGVTCTVFIGHVVTASSHTVTITTNLGSPTLRVGGFEFSSTAGFSAVTLDAAGTIDVTGAGSNGKFPPVTPLQGAGDLYWSFIFDTGTGVVGTTSGYVYPTVDANGNLQCYNLSCANALQQPNIGDPADGTAGIAVMLYEAATNPALADTAASSAGTLSVSAAVPLGDTAAAADALAVSTAVPLGDTAAAADSLTSGSPVSLSDTAAASDALTVTAAVPLSDTAAAADRAANLTPQPGDTAAAADKVTVSAALAVSDTAAAADALTVTAAVPLGDTAAASDARAVPAVTAALHDTAAASDLLVLAKGGPPTLGGVLPGNVGSQVNPPGYQGGPSGAASVVPSALGNSWEVYVYSGLDYVTLLAVIPQSMLLNFQFVRQLDDIGSGTVILSQDDPWWKDVTLPGGLPAETLLDEECLWQFRKDGVPRFEFLGETVTEQLVDPGEQRQVTVTGPGTIAALKWAMVAPSGFPDIVLKLDGLLDSFDEVDVNGHGVVDTNIWTTLTPPGHVFITPIANIFAYPGGVGYNLGALFPSGSLTLEASPSTTFLGSSPYDATDTLVSVQITPIGVASTSTDSGTPASYGTGLNGSELTQFYFQSNKDSRNYAMFGLSASAFYVQIGTTSGPVTKVLPAYDSSAHAYWMITEQAGTGGGAGTFYWWTSPDGQAWTQQWTYVHLWDATNVTFFVTATYSVDNTQSLLITNLNSNVTTPSYQGALYLGVPMMGVWLDQFASAQARGTIPFVTSNVTAARDSYGRPWTDVQNVQAINGTDMYSLLQSACSVVNADYVMDPGFQLRVGQPATGQVALGVDRSGYLILREGSDVASKQRVRARNQVTTLLAGENADGHEISAISPAFIAKWGQRETWFQAAVQVDPVSMAYASAAALAQNEDEIVSWSFSLIPNVPGKTIFDNFDVGDWVGLERPNFSAVDAVRVVGIAVQVDGTGAETHELTFLSYIQWLAEQLTYLSSKLGGQFVNALGTSPVAPSKYGTGQVPTYYTPAATLAGLADVAGNSAGSTMSSAPLVYNPATGSYQHAGTTDPVTGQMIPVTVQTPNGSVTVGDTTVEVTAPGGSTVTGLQGDGTVTSVDSGGSPPSAPDTPTAAGIVQGLVVAWDGLLGGAAPLSNFQYVQVHVGTSSGFTPGIATLVGTLSTGGVLTVSGLTTGTTYFAKLVAVSTAGVASAASAPASAVAAGVPTSLLTGQLPASLIGNSAGNALNPNPFFNGGDLTGWFVTNGTVSAVAPPAGAPGSAQFAARVISTSANCLLSGSTAPFPVTAGQPYAMTAWVYNPGGSAVNVAIGFNWTAGSVTVSVPAGTWVPLTTVQVCPPAVTSAYQVIGPTASGVTVYVLGALAAYQVPGQLLAANSVAAAQIAANTITATQIAAGTITAAQIAANTITAGQIAAATITATQIATATITATQIAASTITATQIAAGTITAAKLAAAIIVAGIVNGTTITGAQVVADGSSGEILVYNSTPASGNLIGSWSATAGSDGFGNGWNAGLWIYDSGGNSIGLVPGGAGAASQIALSTGNGTPTPPAGSASLYGAGSGAVQAVDGVDGQAYGTQRRTLSTGSTQLINSGTPAFWISTPVAAPGGGTRFYHISGKAIVKALGSTGTMSFYFNGPSGVGGNVTFSFYSGSVFATTGAAVAGAANQPGAFNPMVNGQFYIVDFDGIVSIPAGVSGTMGIQAATTGSNFNIAANSFMEVCPV